MTDGKPEFTRFDEVKFITNMGLALTVDGLILTFQCVEVVDVQANRQTTPLPLKFLLSPESALALGEELVRRARPLTIPAKQ